MGLLQPGFIKQCCVQYFQKVFKYRICIINIKYKYYMCSVIQILGIHCAYNNSQKLLLFN